MKDYIASLGRKAKHASCIGASLTVSKKNAALFEMAAALRREKQKIMDANAKDIESADLSAAMLDRLRLNESRIFSMAEGLESVAALNDPIGDTIEQWKRPNGLEIARKRVPLGVVGIIYEARPNVTADAAALCLKTGNAVILKGGKEAFFSNQSIVKILRDALKSSGVPEDMIQLVETTDREAVSELIRLREYVDVVIPRGGAGLIKFVIENASVPAIETGTGNCHVYVDKYADINMAADIVVNAKTQRPAVCNAAETLLVHKDIAADFLPVISKRLREKHTEIRGCSATLEYIPDAVPAVEDDWGTEFLDYILAVKIVDTMDEAIAHIRSYSSGHSESIVTENYSRSRLFADLVDAAAVYINASTRFTDGNEFGFGAEIGISTQKLHARGPMGLNALTTEKYVIYGTGQIRK